MIGQMRKAGVKCNDFVTPDLLYCNRIRKNRLNAVQKRG